MDNLLSSNTMSMSMPDLDWLNFVPVATYVCDGMGRIQSFNRAAVELWGQAPDPNTPDEAFHQTFYPSDFNDQPVSYADTPIAQVLSTGNAVKNRALLLQRADGSEVAVLINASPILNDQAVVGAIASLQDITEQRRTERLLQSVLDNTPGIIYIKDQEGRLLMVNRHFAELAGRPAEDIIGKHDREIFPDPNLQEVLENDRRVLAGDSLVQLEETLELPDGRHTFLSIKLPAEDVGFPGRVLCGFTTDITERKQIEEALKQSEERLRFALDAGHMGAWEWNLETNVQRWDVNQYRLFGVDKDKTELNADLFFQFIYPDDIPLVQQVTQQVLEQGSSFNTEFRIRRSDGSIRWLSSQGMVIRDSNQQPIRMIGVNFDITDRKQAETEREQLLAGERTARKEAETANRIKDEFLAVLSHELRSPLNPILGWAKLLQKGRLDEQTSHRALETIERNAKLQAQLIDDLLDVSRILRGKLVLNTSSVNLATVIESAIETVRLAAAAKQIEIQTVITLDNGRVAGDSTRLQQIVWNLLSNAVKFTAQGGRVEVYLEQAIDRPPAGMAEVAESSFHPPSPIAHYAQIRVRDTGKGIHPNFLPHVFDYFRQEDGKTTRKFGGLGLGLAIVRHLTQLHGGTVQAESQGEEQGATFTVRLPLIAATAETDWVAPIASHPVDLSQLRILIVDDDEDMRTLTQTILEQQGAQVTVATSAAEVLQVFDQHPPDLLISDIGMPDTDGYMLMQQIRSRSPKQGGLVPAIALTAYAGEYDQQQALASGFQRHIPKPMEPETLIRAIVSLLEQPTPT